jgi:hypothetical protein
VTLRAVSRPLIFALHPAPKSVPKYSTTLGDWKRTAAAGSENNSHIYWAISG